MHHQARFYLEEARLVLENDFSEQRLQKALDIYCEVIEQFPDASIEPYLVAAYVALRLQKRRHAQDLLKQAAAIEPFNPLVHQLIRQCKTEVVF